MFGDELSVDCEVPSVRVLKEASAVQAETLNRSKPGEQVTAPQEYLVPKQDITYHFPHSPGAQETVKEGPERGSAVKYCLLAVT